jgi:hypothetical protein
LYLLLRLGCGSMAVMKPKCASTYIRE